MSLEASGLEGLGSTLRECGGVRVRNGKGLMTERYKMENGPMAVKGRLLTTQLINENKAINSKAMDCNPHT